MSSEDFKNTASAIDDLLQKLENMVKFETDLIDEIKRIEEQINKVNSRVYECVDLRALNDILSHNLDCLIKQCKLFLAL